MAHVNVTIAGKSYRMACGEGEEPHLAQLAETLDARVAEMRKAVGEIGDMRLHVMAALTLCDEVAELRARLDTVEREAATLRAGAEAAETALAEGIDRTTQRIERLSRALSAEGPAATREPGKSRP